MDESGDDGFPVYSSPAFVLTALYIDTADWQTTHSAVQMFRRSLKITHGLPARVEMHTKPFLCDKNPYREFGLSESTRLQIIEDYCRFIGSLPLKIINVGIIKPRVKTESYQVLDNALTYLVQRIENDLRKTGPVGDKFLIITDPGRVGAMRYTTRKLQRYNPIPSKIHDGTYREEIKTLIEDPIQKESDQSYFIQMADLVSYIVYLYVVSETKIAKFPNRLAGMISREVLIGWLDALSPVLNLKASTKPYGLVIYPKI